MPPAVARLLARLAPYREPLLVGAFTLELQREAWFSLDGGTLRHVEASVIALAVTGALLLRNRTPLLAVALVFGALLAAVHADPDGDALIVQAFATFPVMLAAGRHVEGRRLGLIVALGTALGLAVLALDAYPTTFVNTASSLLLEVFGPVGLGRLLRDRAALDRALRERARRHEAERTARTAQAVLDERARIAGELHDVVAHALSAMVVQAGGARVLVPRDSARAATAFAAVEATGRDALTEIRSLLGVLRREDEELALAPQPSLQHVAGLVRRTERRGLPVRLRVEGEPRPLPAGVDLTAYRVLQEALESAGDAGGAGRADVALRYGADRVELEVRDDGPRTPRPGLATRERVALYGGELAAGTREGDHVVRVRLPVGGPE